MATKTALRLRCREILAKSAGPVGEVDALFLLTEVFPRHPDWAEKRGPGVSHVELRVHGEYRSRGFFLVRTDGTAVDISYRVAIDGVRNTARFTSAARFEVFGQITEWRRNHPAPADGMHCDHIVPFAKLPADWLGSIDLSSDEIVVTSQRVGYHDLFASRDLALSWQRYHRRHASFQWLAAEANIAKSDAPPDEISSWLADYDRADRQPA